MPTLHAQSFSYVVCRVRWVKVEGAADQSRANQLTKNISPQPYKAAPRIPKDTKPFSLKHQKIPPPPFTPQLPSTQQCFSLASASYFTVSSPQYLIFKRY